MGNGKAEDGKHLYNGTGYEVRGFDGNGNIKLSNGSALSREYGHFNYGYVVTSHSSKGKTTDKIIISQVQQPSGQPVWNSFMGALAEAERTYVFIPIIKKHY
jgi:hypothetical protein